MLTHLGRTKDKPRKLLTHSPKSILTTGLFLHRFDLQNPCGCSQLSGTQFQGTIPFSVLFGRAHRHIQKNKSKVLFIYV